MKPPQPFPAPATQARVQGTPCRRGCCWTPHKGLCPRDWACDCHKPTAQTPRDPIRMMPGESVEAFWDRVAAALNIKES